jgi:siderophore synthetase component
VTVRAADRLADVAETASRALADLAPELVEPFRAALPDAVSSVARRFAGALHREGLREATGVLYRYGFNRVEIAGGLDRAAARDLICDADGPLAAELADAVVGLALGYARRPAAEASRTGGDAIDHAATLPADEALLSLERLSTEGHNLHPCGRTRLGWSIADRLAHDLETPGTAVRWLAVHRALHVGDDLTHHLPAVPDVPDVPSSHVAQPVHAWQLGTVVPVRYPDLLATGALRVLDAPPIPVRPTAALRTVLLPGGGYLKLSLDIQVTSTRRTISVASTRTGPALSALLDRLLAAEPGARILAEPAGAAVVADNHRHRDLAAIVRCGLAGRLEPGELAVPGVALPATCPRTGRTVLARLVARYAAGQGRPDNADTAAAFVAAYARMLLPPLLRLLARSGVALEAHLQNSIPTFVGGVPHRLFLRDLAGMRICQGRLPGGAGVTLWPGSVIGTGDPDVARAKLGYTAVQAHLGEVVIRLVESHGLDERRAWRAVREVVDAAYDGAGGHARADHAFFTAPTMPHKALVRMRLAGTGDVYVPVPNPLA